MTHQAEFNELRPLLFSLAYRMLGTRADAEDIVQEAWIRWEKARWEKAGFEKTGFEKPTSEDAAAESRDRSAEPVRSAKSYLTTIVARLSLDALKAARRKRESYTGPWLPEPLIDPPGTQPIEMAELLSMAFLHLLESLSPAERVAFLLREAFDAGYHEIAETLDTNEENSRQLVARARKRIAERKPRFPVDRTRHQRILKSFLAACASGDPAQITSMLTDDVILYADGGGKLPSALNPIYGPDKIARFITHLDRKNGTSRARFVDVNGEPGAVLIEPSGIVTIAAIELDPNGCLSRIFLVRNPEKIRGIESLARA